ncbi:hypothetical protein A2567_03020 [Candidatus Azambacteria bacterium RIFOXYD1_FULL_42_11]|uniref:Phosphoesterase RecJ domain protein n=4 Tax=Candidatus Azamiibacteriota TaxID=1752741 RepID=A0A0G0ZCE8_9BACT|nr:MAG: Phosphoesterase RecJ domain protein [Candidatus Azambacteria bacterium GW2011_GWB1_42_17]KKS46382.1 MAG: Phosphoesterase RecJ domain protein [Candidatus Azambacteria bacterium GW2011_GWA1_42_19]KKS76013.1 MAG: Phosphoesterase RecJ domain protein [Candidatus Azambacteria bacterium GW2011_GWA2_42_9]KKS88776.1 MAG: Phosphoesterase RecJ domain protein [Parcubacteria group bacterium GW2011_GWC1_43_11]OGD43027.1 MAG: hypothetical protein A2567_03020 [Candidatus Azambacteria bacterium RIFOXYD1
MRNLNFKEIEKIIKKAKRILVATHQGPDGDAIGSLTALGFYLKKIKKPHYLLCVSGVPESLKFIPGAPRIKSKHPKIAYDLIIGLDYGTKSQLGLEGYFKKHPKTPLLVFDHHLFADQDADFGIIGPESSATCELLYDYFKAMGFKIDKKIAEALAVGILTDTGFFKYVKVKKPLEVIVDLMRFGVRPDKIDNIVNGRVKIAAIKLSGKILNRAKHAVKGDFVYSWLKRKELNIHHLMIDDVGNIVIEWLRNLKEGRFALLLIKESRNRIRGRLRSRSDKNYNVARLAMKIDGGGHKFAAGFRFKGTIDGALKAVAKYASKK